MTASRSSGWIHQRSVDVPVRGNRQVRPSAEGAPCPVPPRPRPHRRSPATRRRRSVSCGTANTADTSGSCPLTSLYSSDEDSWRDSRERVWTGPGRDRPRQPGPVTSWAGSPTRAPHQISYRRKASVPGVRPAGSPPMTTPFGSTWKSLPGCGPERPRTPAANSRGRRAVAEDVPTHPGGTFFRSHMHGSRPLRAVGDPGSAADRPSSTGCRMPLSRGVFATTQGVLRVEVVRTGARARG